MAKLPYMQFYPADYLLDTQPLSPAARGIWMDVICLLWRSETRGSLTMTMEQWARVLRCDVTVLVTLFEELRTYKICECVTKRHGDVTLLSRRMSREEKSRHSDTLRQRTHRAKKFVTVVSRVCPPENQISESEVRYQNQKSEEEERKKKTVGEVRDLARPAKSAVCWQRYREAYLQTWCVEPVRNKRTNTDLCALVDRLGEEMAAQVAGFYPGHKRRLYVEARHPTNLLVRDAEALRTDLLNGHGGEREVPRSVVEMMS